MGQLPADRFEDGLGEVSTSQALVAQPRALPHVLFLLGIVVLLGLGVLSLVFASLPKALLLAQIPVALALGVVWLWARGMDRKELLATQGVIQQLEARLKHVEEEALTDSLTHVWNARYLQGQLPKELDRLKRRNLPLSLLMADVDQLKAINDRYGHDVGNEVIRNVARLVQESLRTSDVVGRWGGDEFLALLPEAGKADALAVAKRVHDRLQQYQWQAKGEPVGLRISMGIATFPPDGDTAEELFRKADAAMYMAKKRGGDQITVYAGPVGGKRKAVGEYLAELGVCTTEQLEEALRHCLEANKRGEFLTVGEALAKLGYATEEEIDRALNLQARDRQQSSL